MQIAIALYPGFTVLDAIGPYQVLSLWPGHEVVVCAERTGRVTDEKNLLHFDVEHTFADVPEPDILVVPGGTITRGMAVPGNPVVEWIRAAHPHTTWTTSVCTGALLLGAAGLLRGLDATTHWRAHDALRRLGANPLEQRTVRDGKIMTAAGVSAGIDMALTLVAEVDGPEVAQAIQLGIEYDPQPPFDAGAPSKAPAPIVELVNAVMEAQETEVAARA
jgi:transcriptional regulator GlxA family with amidase domain